MPAGTTTAEDEPALYSSKITLTYLRLVKSKYSYVNITELLEYAGMEQYQVEDDGHWFTQTQVDRFHERLSSLTGNPSISREAGRYNASPEGLGVIPRYVFGLAGPAKAFELIGKIASTLTRSTVFEYRKLSPNRIEVTVTPREGVHEKPYQCDNRMGSFEAIVSGFNYRLPRIEHEECVFKGASVCRYVISWTESRAAILKRVQGIVAGASVLALGIIAAFAPPRLVIFDGAGIAAALLLVVSLLYSYFERKELHSSINYLRSTTEKFLENAQVNYDHALMINEIGRIISKYRRTDVLLSQVIDIMHRRLDYDRGLILLANEDKSRLVFETGYGFQLAMVEEIRGNAFHLDSTVSRGVFVLCYKERRPFLVNDVDEIESELSPRSLEFLRRIGSKSFVCCPILYEDECLGVLVVDNIASKRPLLESDINLLMGIAPEIGIALYNAMMTEERERQFRSILSTLAASIDARDSLTAGHSERVTEYSMAICDELGIGGEEAEVIRVASMLHDYGKIGIKDSILKKRGPLSGKEREEIKKHSVKTQEILERISFTGAYRQVPFIAGAHHERLNGTGYPMGLLGDQIPLGAKIIAVADFFEAITARRHYRDPLPFVEAVQMLEKESGHHLDGAVIEALLKSIAEGKVQPPAIVV